MEKNKFFTVEVDDSLDEALRVMPTDYLEALHPHQAIAEMKEQLLGAEVVGYHPVGHSLGPFRIGHPGEP